MHDSYQLWRGETPNLASDALPKSPIYKMELARSFNAVLAFTLTFISSINHVFY